MEMNPLRLNLESGRTRAQISADIIRKIYQKDGYRGFYRGYVASLCAYVPNSALWWGLYTVYQGKSYCIIRSVLDLECNVQVANS